MRRDIDDEVLAGRRQAGVCLHLTSLPGAYGVGEIGASARRFIDTLRRMDLRVWQFLPLGPTGYGDSPYQPLSTFAGNEMLLDVEDLVHRGLLDRNRLEPLTNLPASQVDYGALHRHKPPILRDAAIRFTTVADSDTRTKFEEFLQRHDERWLHDYALFRVLKSRFGESAWPTWPTEYAQRDPHTMQTLESEFADAIRSIKVLQFLFAQQWYRLRQHADDAGVALLGDLPIYIALDSADAWSRPELLRIDEAGRAEALAGVPPDYFSPDGQLWGNPLYDWARHANADYGWWIARMQALLEFVHVVRIDHFRAFHAYWSLPPQSKTARDGQWEAGPGDALFDAMKMALGSLPIVAEDLGVITTEVRELRDRHQLPGMVVLQFAVADAEFELDRVPERCVCYTGTHDNDTTLGWYYGHPDDGRSSEQIAATQRDARKVTRLNGDSLSLDFVRAAFSTPAQLAVAPMQDFLGLGSEARLNRPGVADGNWRWRLADQQPSGALCEQVAFIVQETGRGDP